MPRDSRALPTRDAGQRAQGLSPSSRDERQQQLVATSARWSLRRDRVDILLTRVDVEVVENRRKMYEKLYDKPRDKPHG